MPRHHRFRRFAHVIAVGLLFATAADVALSAPVNGPNITEQRNAAVGFAITLWMVNVDALGDHCSKLGSPSDAQSMNALKSWQSRNSPYVNAALEYMVDIEDFISAKQGEEERRKFRADRKSEFVASTRKAEALWFPDGKIDEASCLNMASHAADGSMDLDKDKAFFTTLQAIKAETGSEAKEGSGGIRHDGVPYDPAALQLHIYADDRQQITSFQEPVFLHAIIRTGDYMSPCSTALATI